jgi:hypothetical protein
MFCFTFGFFFAYYLLQNEATLSPLQYRGADAEGMGAVDGDVLHEEEVGMHHFKIPIIVPPPINGEVPDGVVAGPKVWGNFETEANGPNAVPINYNIHIFYYAW